VLISSISSSPEKPVFIKYTLVEQDHIYSIRGWAYLLNPLSPKLPMKEDRMAFGITKTIPAREGMGRVEALYDGTLAEYEFHMAGKPSRLTVGHYVYTIFKDQLHGRLKIKSLIDGAVNPKSGRPRTLILVSAPGERLSSPIPMKGHRGTRYYDGSDWPKED
jgi:hypothetical protein